MGVLIFAAVVVGLAAIAVVVMLRRRERDIMPASEAFERSARPSVPAEPPPPVPAPARSDALPPHRIVLAAEGVPVVDLSRMRGSTEASPGDPVDAPRLAERLAAVARESTHLMELPGADRCRVRIRVEVARAMQAGILPLLLSKSPVAPITGEGVETLAAEPGLLAELGVVAWEAACAERVRRTLAGLEGRLSVLAGGSTTDAVAAIRARRADLFELLRRILQGEPNFGSRLEEVEASSHARTDELLRQVASLRTPAQDAALVLRQVGGTLLLVIALRAAAVEVRAVHHHNPDLVLTKLVELEGLVGKVAGVITARRGPEVADAVNELLAQSKELEGMLRASRERLFAREVELHLEVAPDGALVRMFLPG